MAEINLRKKAGGNIPEKEKKMFNKALAEFLSKYQIKRPFRPIVYYDENMDAIFVFFEDASYSEIYISHQLRIFKANHRDGRADFIGLAIYDASRLLDQG